MRRPTEGAGCAAGVGVNIEQRIQQWWDDVLSDDTVPLETIIAGMLLEMLILDEEETPLPTFFIIITAYFKLETFQTLMSIKHQIQHLIHVSWWEGIKRQYSLVMP